MPYVIEIAHPSEAINNVWKFVSEVSERNDAYDIIESPLFDYQNGTCIRVRDGKKIDYTGIYGDSGCYDIGPDSIFMGTLTWAFDASSREFTKGMNFIDAWAKSDDPQSMIRSISKIIPRLDLVKITYAISQKLSYSSALKKDVDQFKEFILDWIEGSPLPKNIERVHDKLVNASYAVAPGVAERVASLSAVYNVIVYDIADSDYAAAYVVDNACLVRSREEYPDYDIGRVPIRRREEKKFAAYLRKIVPFHLIATNIQNHQLKYRDA